MLKIILNRGILFVLFFSTFSISCTHRSFVCWNEKNTKAIAFEFSDDLRYVKVSDIHSYNILNSKKIPLNSNMPGGTHKLEINQNSITLKVIQDTVFTKTQLPSGKFIKYHSEIKSQHDYLNQRRYHAVYPVVWKYVFNRDSLKLSFSLIPLPKPRKSIEQKFIYDENKKNLYPEKVRNLTEKESALIFPSHEKTKTFIYPKCKEEDAHSLKKFLRTISKYLKFV